MKISQKKREKICEQILAYLYSVNPKPLFTSHIAQEVARDEEFVKDLLNGLNKQGLVVKIKKNSQGEEYFKRIRWKMSEQAYEIYSRQQKVL